MAGFLGFFERLFDTTGFPPRWQCGTWTEGHGWLHVISDVATFGAYTAIPAVLAFFVIRRKDLVFPRIFWLFCLFIFSCGAVHLVEATIFWQPWYRLSGLIKAITAVASWATVVALARIAPAALRLPSLAVVNQRLEREVAERQRTENELARSNRDLTDFAYVASHDLRAPLRGIRNLSRWIQEDAGGSLSPTAQQHLEQLGGRVDRMERLLDDLLDYSRAGRVHGSVERVDSGELVRDIGRTLDLPPGFVLSIDPSLPTFTTLRTPLEVCLRNLISNAIQHHDGKQGHIRVWCTETSGTLDFHVQDDGPGIDPEHQERIFGTFQRLPSPGASQGHGLGLAIVRKQVNTYGGGIRLVSSPGAGATFTLSWPRRIPLEPIPGADEPGLRPSSPEPQGTGP